MAAILFSTSMSIILLKSSSGINAPTTDSIPFFLYLLSSIRALLRSSVSSCVLHVYIRLNSQSPLMP